MSGSLVVDGEPILGVMPSFQQLPDADLAEILTYLSQQGSGGRRIPPFTAKEIAQQRGSGATAQQVADERKVLVAQKMIP
jgi:hypothetical protein